MRRRACFDVSGRRSRSLTCRLFILFSALLAATHAQWTKEAASDASFLRCKALPAPPAVLDVSFDSAEVAESFALSAGEPSVTIRFTLTKTSALRAEAWTEHAAGVSLRLEAPIGTAVYLSPASEGPQRSSAAAERLLGGAYALTIAFDPPLDGAACPSFGLRLSLAPRDELDARLAALRGSCAGGERPAGLRFDGGRAAEGGFEYDSAAGGEACAAQARAGLLASWPLELPALPGRAGAYALEASLAADFLPHGGLALALRPAAGACEGGGRCWRAAPHAEAARNLAAALPAGSYVLELRGDGSPAALAGPCAPYAIALSARPLPEPESFLSCQAERLPEDLNGPGGLDAGGRLLWSADALVDLSRPRRTIPLRVAVPSALRVYAEPHRTADVDLFLRPADDPRRALASSFAFSGPDGLVAELQPGAYVIEVAVYGRASKFCDTFGVQFAVAPLDDAPYPRPADCPAPSSALGALEGMDAALAAAPYAFAATDRSTVRYAAVDPAAATPELLRREFAVARLSRLVADAAFDFLWGALELTVYPTGALGRPVLADVRASGSALVALLPPGNYTLVLRAATTQRTPPPALTRFPRCVGYTLALDVRPVPAASPGPAPPPDGVPDVAACWARVAAGALVLPPSLNIPGYAAAGRDRARLAGPFLMPRNARLETTVRATGAAFVRIRSGAAGVDPDLALVDLASGSAAHSKADSPGTEEFLTGSLPAGAAVRLVVTLGAPPPPSAYDATCPTVWLELQLGPADSLASEGPACPPAAEAPAPPAALELSGDPPGSVLEGLFALRPTTVSPADAEVRFLVPAHDSGGGAFSARATLDGPFLTGALGLELVGPDGRRHGAQRGPAPGARGVPSAFLPPGEHFVRVYQADYSEAATRCYPFRLTFRLQRGPPPGAAPANGTCGAALARVPVSLDRPGLLGPAAPPALHVARRFLVPLPERRAETRFTVAGPGASLLRVAVPPGPAVDVDVDLYAGTGPERRLLARRASFDEEEEIVAVLQPGVHSLVFAFYPSPPSAPLPDPASCASFFLEVGLAPASALAPLRALTAACRDEPPPDSLPVGSLAAAERHARPRTSGAYARTIRFDFDRPGTLALEVAYDFLTSRLRLDARCTERRPAGPATRALPVFPRPGRAYVREGVLAGNCTVTLADAAPTFGGAPEFAFLSCAPYALSYAVAAPPGGGGACDLSARLPRRADAGDESRAWGGPQAADGSLALRVPAAALSPALDPAAPRDDLLLAAPRDLVLRAFAAPAARGSATDIDFEVRAPPANCTSEEGELIAAAAGGDETESVAALLPASPACPYTLSVVYFRVDEGAPGCPTFDFLLAARPREALLQELACPLAPPEPAMPPARVAASGNQCVAVSGDSFLVTPEARAAMATGWLFRRRHNYEIRVAVEGTAALSASVSYSFLHADFALLLADPDGRVLARSRPTPRGGPGRDFGADLEAPARLEPGTYTLTLSLGDFAAGRFGAPEGHCLPFGFELRVDHSEAPRLLSVEPPGGRGLDPRAPLYLTLRFSGDLAVPPADLLPVLQASAAAQLECNAVLRQPRYASYGASSQAEVNLSFEPLGAPGAVCELKVRPDAIPTAADPAQFFHSDGLRHAYEAADCGCSRHGLCHPDAGDGEPLCACEAHYEGPDCGRCAAGYHWAGDDCVPDVKCAPDSCSGHGACDDSQGVPVCTCAEGFASAGGAQCAACAPGHFGYPRCSGDDAVGSRISAQCPDGVRTLPPSLDRVPYLPYSGRAHLAGAWFMDLAAMRAEVAFTAREATLVRVHVGAAALDVDVALYDAGGDASPLAKAAAAYGEEALEAHVGPGRHRLVFQYYDFDGLAAAAGPCPAFPAEILVAPYAQVAAAAARLLAPLCPAGAAPALPALGPAVRVGPPDRASFRRHGEGPPPAFLFETPLGALFWSRNLPPPAAPAGEPEPGPRFLLAVPVLVAPGARTVAHARVRLAHRFELGPLGAMLVAGSPPQTGAELLRACAAPDPFEEEGEEGSRPPPPRCAMGVPLRDGFALDADLVPGNYTLHVYQPRAGNASYAACAPFELAVRFDYEPVAEDTFSCPARRLPASLNVPGYIDPAGYLFVEDDFAIDRAARSVDLPFALERPSLFRAYHGPNAVDVDFELYAADEAGQPLGKPLAAALEPLAEETLYIELAAGKYVLTLVYYMPHRRSPAAFCSSFRLALALAPLPLPKLSAARCPSTGVEVLPALPTPARFPLEAAAIGYTANNASGAAVASYRLLLTLPLTVVEVEVASEFLTADLTASVRPLDRRHALPLRASRARSSNRLAATLPAGNYSLAVERRAPLLPPGPPCLEFRLAVALRMPPLAIARPADAGEAPEGCPAFASSLPGSVEGPEFLGDDGRLDLLGEFVMPALDFGALRAVNVSVRRPSLLRAYLERNAVDIDLALVNRGRPADDPSRSVASSASFNDEEALVFPLEPSVLYTLEVTFYRWTAGPLGPCPRFVLHLAVAPAAAPPQATCPDGGLERLPPAVPPTVRLGIDDYEYESEAAGGGLRLQQRRGEARRFDYGLTVAAPARLHAEVSSDFLTADLNLRLFALDADADAGAEARPGEDAGVGAERDGRSLLALDSLAPGRYVLRVYEPASNGDGARCAPFAFALRIAAAAAAETRFPPPVGLLQLPGSLDSVAFLGVAGAAGRAEQAAAHAAGLLAIPAGRQRVSRANFTLDVATVLRAYAAPHRIDVDLLLFRLEGGSGRRGAEWEAVGASDGAYGEESLLLALQPGTYLLQVEFYPSKAGYYPGPREREAVPFELALEPAAAFASRLPSRTGCLDVALPAPALGPDGYYRRDEGELALSWQTAAAAGVGPLRVAEFTVPTLALLHAAVGHDFAASGLALALNRSSPDGSGWREVAAAARGAGWLELQAPLAPGAAYRLVLRQPAAPLDAFPHCTLYSAAVLLADPLAQPRPAPPGGGEGGGQAPAPECALFGAPLPTELAERDPAAAFGASVDGRGVIALAGGRFLVPADAAALAVPLRGGGGPHLLRTFARWPAGGPGVEVAVRPFGGEDPGAYLPIDRDDDDEGDDDRPEGEGGGGDDRRGRRRALLNATEPLPGPAASAFGPNWRSELRIVPASASPLQVEVRRAAGAGPACAPLAFGLAVAPVEAALRGGLCAAADAADGAARWRSIGSLQAGADGRLAAYAAGWVPLEAALGPGPAGAPLLEAPLRLPRDSSLDAALAFDHSAAFFTLELLRGVPGGRQVSVAKSEGTPHASAAPISFTQELHGALPAGDYVLLLRGDAAALRALARARGLGDAAAGAALCLPFVWSLRVAPARLEQSAPPPAAVRAVSPPGTLHANPARPLRLRVAFSSPPYNASGPYPPGPAAEPQRRAALFLRAPGGPPVLPRRAAAWGPAPLLWTLEFAPGALASGQPYALEADPALLRAADGSPVPVPAGEFRVLDTSCGGPARGAYVASEGYCLCSAGHGGPACGACDSGYGPGPDPQSPCAPLGPLRPTPAPPPPAPARRFCTRDSCSGHGRCWDGDGSVRCECFANFGGPSCARCADGYLRYPACEKAAACAEPCAHGRCDAATGRCVCEVNWAGPRCDACAPGFAGATCALADAGRPPPPPPPPGPGPSPAPAPAPPPGGKSKLVLTLSMGAALLAAGGAVAIVLRRRAAAPPRRGTRGRFPRDGWYSYAPLRGAGGEEGEEGSDGEGAGGRLLAAAPAGRLPPDGDEEAPPPARAPRVRFADEGPARAPAPPSPRGPGPRGTHLLDLGIDLEPLPPPDLPAPAALREGPRPPSPPPAPSGAPL